MLSPVNKLDVCVSCAFTTSMPAIPTATGVTISARMPLPGKEIQTQNSWKVIIRSEIVFVLQIYRTNLIVLSLGHTSTPLRCQTLPQHTAQGGLTALQRRSVQK